MQRAIDHKPLPRKFWGPNAGERNQSIPAVWRPLVLFGLVSLSALYLAGILMLVTRI